MPCYFKDLAITRQSGAAAPSMCHTAGVGACCACLRGHNPAHAMAGDGGPCWYPALRLAGAFACTGLPMGLPSPRQGGIPLVSHIGPRQPSWPFFSDRAEHAEVQPVGRMTVALGGAKPIFDSALRQVIERTRQSTPRRWRGTTRLVYETICSITGDRATPATGDTRLAATRRANRSMTHCRFASPRTWLVL
jgi:hypothetical protein